ncbi:hypothetical protein [Lelliottia wanjuensis]|uniref:hypothetical protein n=1 Tax=Lelliottia wanjuensis TaxID=3050585 RepID=UPI00254C217C|nr:hypothetical protein [Lelliottia sp. V106_16]MDK9356758.1 hypothetical protein [Lelliottia sp. V106_16]
MNIQLMKAAQSRAASAVAVSNPLLWDEAKALYRAGYQWQDSAALLGAVRPYGQINIDDAEINFESYGDHIVCDGDNMKAQFSVNLELPEEVFK